MKKSLFILLISLFVVGLVAQVQVSDYSQEGKVKLIADIKNLGYTSDQRILVVLGNNAPQKFYVYYGLRSDTSQTITITDGTLVINPSTFAFTQDESMLIVGSSEGSIYGFAIEGGKVQTQYKYKYNVQTTDNFGINSISISKGNKIALAAKDKIVVLQVPTDESNIFKFIKQHPYGKTVTAVAWKNDDQNSILVGCLGIEGQFDIYDLNADTTTSINTQSTSSIGVFKDGRVIQGRVTKDMQIFKWNGDNQQYQTLGTIPDTVYATQIIMDKENQYFGAQIKSTTKVLAWKIDALTEKNLKNSQILTLPTQLLNQTGTNLAISGNGNQILVITDTTQTVSRFNLCKDGSYFNNGDCLTCTNNCDDCFDADTCITCPVEFYITADDKCASCHDVTPGCKTCLNQNTCTLCDAALHRKQAVENGVCVCDTVTYPVEDQCKLCIDSIDFCETCSDADHCITCYPDGNINPTANDEGKCICLDGWYLQEKVCKDCPTAITGCKFCDDAKTCTECNAQDKFQQDGKGGCQCMEGNWFNPTTLACQLCQTSVSGCLSCTQSGQCNVCSQERRVPNDDKTQCVCQPHTFENPQNICQVCDPYEQCLQCEKQAPNACTKCDTSKGRAQKPVNGVCQCNRGFIENDDTHDCIACAVPGCQQCDKAQVCDTCFAQKHFKQTPENGVCVCESNYHLVDNKTECLTCNQVLTGCKDCDNLKQCKQCDESSNFQLNEETKLCKCKSSFFEENKECKLCSQHFDYCQTCDKENCQSCKNGFSFNEDEKKCYCPDDRDFDQKAGSCEEKAGLSALAIIAIIVGILALAGAAVALIKCFKKRQSPLEDGEYEALEGKDK